MQRRHHPLVRCWPAAALLSCSLHGHAQPPLQLADPTRPRSAAEPLAAAPAVSERSAAPSAWPKLQSVQIPAQGEASAMVDGRIVRVGERIGEATLTAIGANSIVLRSARYEQHISLTPGIAKIASVTAQSTPQPAVALATKERQ